MFLKQSLRDRLLQLKQTLAMKLNACVAASAFLVDRKFVCFSVVVTSSSSEVMSESSSFLNVTTGLRSGL